MLVMGELYESYIKNISKNESSESEGNMFSNRFSDRDWTPRSEDSAPTLDFLPQELQRMIGIDYSSKSYFKAKTHNTATE